jgi:pimeloyl-ACP methyl ester carboxylesterase
VRFTAPIEVLPDERGDCPGSPVPIRGNPVFQLVHEEFRVNPTLRAAARGIADGTTDPYDLLARAAEVSYLDSAPDAVVRQSANGLVEPLTDLAVSGRIAFTKFAATPLDEAALQAKTTERLRPVVDADPVDVAAAVATVLDRAYAVAWALRGPAPQRAAARAALEPNWIAVSGEDDKPARPVNVPQPSYVRADTGVRVDLEQFEIPVPTPATRGSTATPFQPFIQTRFLIVSAVEDPAPPPVVESTRQLPPVPVASIPFGHEVLLFLHGDCSSAEEVLAIAPHILQAGLDAGKKYSIVGVDMPNNGYSESFGHEQVAPSAATSWPDGVTDQHTPIGTPILDFMEDFVVAFVDALDQVTPVKSRFAGVIGGSLGGNLGLRLGRRPIAANPWLDASIVSWSAASVWEPMVQDLAKTTAPRACRDHWMLPETIAPDHDTRVEDFYETFDHSRLVFPHTQPSMWYRGDWEPCKQNHIDSARIGRQELYCQNFRQWHWRLSAEQLIYSHVDRVDHLDSTTPQRYRLNTVRQLLASGDGDNYKWANIFSATRKLTRWMVSTPGIGLLMKDTGHSIHVERPVFFANAIVKFLTTPSMQITCITRETEHSGRILSVGGVALPAKTHFTMTEAECIDAIHDGSDFFVVGSDGVHAEVIVEHGPPAFLTTKRDRSRANNLLALPPC